MSGRVSVTLGVEVLEAVEAVRQGLRPKPSVSATVAMLVEDGLRARAAAAALRAELSTLVQDAERAGGDELWVINGQTEAVQLALRLLGEGEA